MSEPLRRRETRHSDGVRKRKSKLPGADIPPHNYKAYQLYTLYRGKDGKVMQASARTAGYACARRGELALNVTVLQVSLWPD